nr:unnamed protein product [Spirometra erinaceieuropaei]
MTPTSNTFQHVYSNNEPSAHGLTRLLHFLLSTAAPLPCTNLNGVHDAKPHHRRSTPDALPPSITYAPVTTSPDDNDYHLPHPRTHENAPDAHQPLLSPLPSSPPISPGMQRFGFGRIPSFIRQALPKPIDTLRPALIGSYRMFPGKPTEIGKFATGKGYEVYGTVVGGAGDVGFMQAVLLSEQLADDDVAVIEPVLLLVTCATEVSRCRRQDCVPQLAPSVLSGGVRLDGGGSGDWKVS